MVKLVIMVGSESFSVKDFELSCLKYRDFTVDYGHGQWINPETDEVCREKQATYTFLLDNNSDSSRILEEVINWLALNSEELSVAWYLSDVIYGIRPCKQRKEDKMFNHCTDEDLDITCRSILKNTRFEKKRINPGCLDEPITGNPREGQGTGYAGIKPVMPNYIIKEY